MGRGDTGPAVTSGQPEPCDLESGPTQLPLVLTQTLSRRARGVALTVTVAAARVAQSVAASGSMSELLSLRSHGHWHSESGGHAAASGWAP